MLVVQFPEAVFDDQRFTHLESTLDELWEGKAEVDGHDVGKGRLNIYILTKDPHKAFNILRRHLVSIDLLDSAKVASRDMDESDFEFLWPPDLKAFSID